MSGRGGLSPRFVTTFKQRRDEFKLGSAAVAFEVG
jgi:hypothetical protein